MGHKPHYFAIGLFVLAATALGIVGVVMLSADSMHSPEYFLETYVDESVQGIDVGTPFKFRGVKVGNVSEIKMVSSEYNTTKMYVMIRVALSDKEMLKEAETIPDQIKTQIANGLRMKIVPQGITGLSFLEAEYFPETELQPLEIDWKPKYAYIPSTPSMMTLLGRSVEHITAEINMLNLGAIGQNIESITSNLNESAVHIETITHHVAEVSDEVTENVRLATADLPHASSNLTETITSLQQIVIDSDRDVEQILVNLRYITADTRELIRMVKRYPGMLLAEPPKETFNSGGKRK